MKAWGLGFGKARRKKRKDREDKAKRRREESKQEKELDQLTNVCAQADADAFACLFQNESVKKAHRVSAGCKAKQPLPEG